MTTVKIDISDKRAEALAADAEAHGMTLADWISHKLADEEAPMRTTPQSPQEAAARILELQQRVQPDPEGWTVHDYISYGRH